VHCGTTTTIYVVAKLTGFFILYWKKKNLWIKFLCLSCVQY